MAGHPPIFESPEQMQEIADAFLLECQKRNVRPTITRLCYNLGFESRQSFYDYEKREQFSYIVKRLRLWIESGYEEALSNNSPTGAIFALKNMGWKDKSEVEQSGTITKQIIYEPQTGNHPIKD